MTEIACYDNYGLRLLVNRFAGEFSLNLTVKKHSTVILNPIADDKKMVIVFATVITNVSTFKLTITLKYGPMTKAWLFVLPNRPLL